MRTLITGCSTGIGRAAALALAKRGHEVIATARRPETLAGLEVAERLALDVNDEGSVEAVLARVGSLDALVNNAGSGISGPVEKVPLDEARRLFETNFFGAARMIQGVLPGMRQRGAGVIVNVSSVAGLVAPPLSGFYAASKFALEGLSEALHLEVGHFGIRVAIVEPGYIDTDFRGNQLRCGLDEAPYDELARVWEGTDDKLLGGPRPSAEIAGEAIADAVEGRAQALRQPVGKDAEMVSAARKRMDDAEFEASMRAMLKLDW